MAAPDAASHAAGPPAPLRLRLRRAPEAEAAGGARVALAAPDALLLAWLAIEGATPRERLAALLWPGSAAGAARAALRQRLRRLAQACGAPPVCGEDLASLAEGVQHDLEHSPTLLEGLPAPAGAELASWLEAERSRRALAERAALEAQIEAFEAASDWPAALPLAHALLARDRSSEDAHRRLMRLHYLRGDRAAALGAFDDCERWLKHEVGARPDAATLALLAVIEAGGAVPPPPAATAPDPPAAQTPSASPAVPALRWPRPAGLPAALLRPPRLVGRADALAALLRSAAAGGPVLLVGEAGIGKSRLLHAATQEPALAGCTVTACRPGDALVPYASLARWLRAVFEWPPEALAAADRRALAPLLPDWAEAPAAPTPGDAASAAPVRTGPPAEALQRLLALAVPAPPAWALDDLHFADAASLELLGAVLAAARSVPAAPAWLLASRPPSPGSALASFVISLAAAGPLARIEPAPLAPRELAELVDALAMPGWSGPALAAPLAQRSGGNPLFALETLKAAWSASPDGAAPRPQDLPRPGTVGQLVAQQVERLSPPALALARVAAVAGADFSLPLAAGLLGASALSLADPWRELERQQLLVGAEFAHDGVLEAVLDGLPAVIAQHLHGEVAAWLERAAGEPARVAAHWEAAGRRERALPHLRAAADRAHRALREVERIDFLLRAADIAEAAGRSDEAFECVEAAVETHMNSIRQADGLPLLDRLDRLATAPAARARAAGHRAWYLSTLGEHAEAVRVGEQALEAAIALGETAPPALAGQVRQRLATALAMLGRFDEALAHFDGVRPWAEATLAREDLAEFHGNFAVALDNLGRPEAAREHHRAAIAASAGSGDHAQHATHLANHAVSRLNAGDTAGAEVLVAQAQALCDRYAMHGSSAAFIRVLHLQCARAEGRYGEALEDADLADRLLARHLPGRRPLVALQLALTWLDLGQSARAQQALAAAAPAAGPPGLPGPFEARRQWLQARLAARLGEPVEVHLDAAAAVAPANGWPEIAMQVELDRARVAAAHAAPGSGGSAAARARAIASIERIATRAVALGLHGTVLAAWAARAAVADGANAAAAAREALALARSAAPSGLTRGELWLAAAEGLASEGAADESEQARARGREWVLATSRTHVPEVFRDSFCRRHPAHARLLGSA
jgi:tetratricopeptide (TPR) repeat protein